MDLGIGVWNRLTNVACSPRESGNGLARATSAGTTGLAGRIPRVAKCGCPEHPGSVEQRRSEGAGPSIGVALSGGGAAGFAHLGVLEALVDAGIRIECVAGTSAGALVGAAFASGKLEELCDTLKGLSWSRVIGLFDPTWPRAGLFDGRRALELVGPCLRERIEDVEVPFAAIATDLHTGEEVVIDRGPTLEAIRASAALPGIFTPRLLNGRTLVDGGLVNSIPVSAARGLGADFVIAESLYPIPARSWSGPMTVVANAPLPEKPRDMAILDILAQSSALVQTRIATSRFRDAPPSF